MSKAYAAGFNLIHADWDSVYENMLALAQQSLSKLSQALNSSSVPEILQLRKDVETLEEQGDDVKDMGFDRLYSIVSTMQYLQFSHYSNCCINATMCLTPAKTFPI